MNDTFHRIGLLALAVALLGASPCFGDKPVTCEAWHQVYTCDKFGCVRYGLTPVDPYAALPSAHIEVAGMTQWIPDGNGVLNVACVPFTDVAAMCYGWPDPEDIPQSEMRPIP